MPNHNLNNDGVYQFGNFEIDLGQSLLSRAGESVKLAPKAFDLLVYFVRNSNQVISKQTLMDAVWQDAFVEDANLAVHISSLRKILAQDNENSAVIETFPKIGYRFTADVRICDRSPVETGATVSPVPVANRASLVKRVVRKRGSFAVAGSIFLLVLLVVSIVSWRWAGRRAEQTIVPLPGMERSTSFALSPNGEYIAHASARDAKYSLMMTHIATGSSVQLLPPESAVFWGMTFSKDGSFLYYVRGDREGNTLYRIPNLGTSPTKILEDVGEFVTVSPDGGQFAFVRKISKDESALMVADTDGNRVAQIALRKTPDFYSSSQLGWSPDGKWIAVFAGNSSPGRLGRIVVVNVASGSELPLTAERWRGSEGIEWLPDGGGIVAGLVDKEGNVATQIWRIPFPADEPNRITNDLNNYRALGISADGTKLIAGQFKDVSGLWVVPPAASEPAKPVQSERPHLFRWVRWLHDGRFTFGSNVLGNRDIWVMNADGTQEARLTENSGYNVMPVGSPDGRFIVFSSDRAGRGAYNLWRMDGDGSSPQQLTFGTGEIQPAFSPDGKWVFYTSGTIGGPELEREVWKVPAEGGEPVRLIDGPAYAPDVSPDGRFIVSWYLARPDAIWSVGIFGVDGGLPVRTFTLPNGSQTAWTPDGKGISFVKTVDLTPNVWIQPIEGGEASPYTNFTSERIVNIDWSKDGRLVCTRTAKSREIVIISNFR